MEDGYPSTPLNDKPSQGAFNALLAQVKKVTRYNHMTSRLD